MLPHLAASQMDKKLKDGITGEDLNLLIGSIPYNDEKISEAVKLNILSLLNEKYGKYFPLNVNNDKRRRNSDNTLKENG